MQLILASGSTARRTMLGAAGVEVQAMASGVDEAALKAGFRGTPAEMALVLAREKAAVVAARHPEALVIGADQLLVCGIKIFDKPANMAEAAAHLAGLSGQTHELVTAVCVMRGPALLWSHVEPARLTMRELSTDFIAGYLTAEGDQLLESVGAYRLEGLGAQLFTHVEGDYFTVLGLPLLALLGFLRTTGALAG